MTNATDLNSTLLPVIQAISVNPIRIRNVSCATCTTPSAPDELCGTCYGHRATWSNQLADRAVPLTYAVRTTQSYWDARSYKDPTIPDNPSLYRLRIHAYFFNILHARCLNKIAAQPVDGLVIVPSLSGRSGQHPLELVAEFLPHQWGRIIAHPGLNIPQGVNQRRIINPEFYVISNPVSIKGRHIVVFEDTWTSGGHVQGMAVKLKQLGASEVSIVVLNRDIVPSYGDNDAFLKRYASKPYNPYICPVTGGACPS